jgi:hypothetical protein
MIESMLMLENRDIIGQNNCHHPHSLASLFTSVGNLLLYSRRRVLFGTISVPQRNTSVTDQHLYV